MSEFEGSAWLVLKSAIVHNHIYLSLRAILTVCRPYKYILMLYVHDILRQFIGSFLTRSFYDFPSSLFEPELQPAILQYPNNAR